MNDRDGVHSFDRRLFLVSTGALALMNAGSAAAQEKGGKPMSVPDKRLRQMLAEFVVGFDLSNAPADVVAAARTGFIDTLGVAIAGSHEEVSHIVAEMVKLEGSAQQCTVIGQSFRASPQLAALANGVATHAMDYDHSLHERPVGGAGDPRAACRSPKRTARRPPERPGCGHRGERDCRAHPALKPAAEQWRRLAHDRHRRRHFRGGSLREADEASSRPGRQCHRHCRLAGAAGCRSTTAP